MKNKPLKKHSALKGMAYKHYGPRAENLIQLMNNNICSPFFYTCRIINKWSDKQLKPFNVIQTKALRIALGLPQWTPNIVLMKLAGQEILSDKIRRLLISAFGQHDVFTNLLESSKNAFKVAGSIAFHHLPCYLATLDLNTLSNLNIPFSFLELIGNKREFIFPKKTPKKISGKVPYRFVTRYSQGTEILKTPPSLL
ncbi:putative RNA-directed DNA polymerase from transposon BS [Trichonephila clavipes]|nr:putative RNA-directed DNA polymerase from transposon BS [Trichonephila clavipes]